MGHWIKLGLKWARWPCSLITITASEISVSRNGQGWDVEVEYQVSRKLGDEVDLIFDFSISSDRAGLWASNNQS